MRDVEPAGATGGIAEEEEDEESDDCSPMKKSTPETAALVRSSFNDYCLVFWINLMFPLI